MCMIILLLHFFNVSECLLWAGGGGDGVEWGGYDEVLKVPTEGGGETNTLADAL